MWNVGVEKQRNADACLGALALPPHRSIILISQSPIRKPLLDAFRALVRMRALFVSSQERS